MHVWMYVGVTRWLCLRWTVRQETGNFRGTLKCPQIEILSSQSMPVLGGLSLGLVSFPRYSPHLQSRETCGQWEDFELGDPDFAGIFHPSFPPSGVCYPRSRTLPESTLWLLLMGPSPGLAAGPGLAAACTGADQSCC